MEKYQLSIDSAKKQLDSVSYMMNKTLPFIKDNRFIIKIFEELHQSMVNLVKAVLQYEYLYKRVRLYQDADSNFEVFKECARRYNIPLDNISKIKKVFMLMRKHKESPMEFVKKDKFVILSDNLHTETLTADTLKAYYAMAKEIVEKAGVVFERKD